jgi:flagellar hook-length control protein FliK
MEARVSEATRTRRTTTDTALAPDGMLAPARSDPAAAGGAVEPAARAAKLSPSQLLETVLEQADRAPQVLRIRLTPPHLGEVEVIMRSRGGRLQLTFRCQTGEAAARLRNQVGTLRSALRARGFTLGRCQITSARSQAGARSGKPHPTARPHKRGNR